MLKNTTIILIIIAIILLILSMPMLFQEENPIPVLVGVSKLIFTDREIVEIIDDNNRYIAKAENASENIKEIMADDGYEFSEQMGAGYFFDGDDGDVLVISRMYTRWFTIFEIEK